MTWLILCVGAASSQGTTALKLALCVAPLVVLLAIYMAVGPSVLLLGLTAADEPTAAKRGFFKK